MPYVRRNEQGEIISVSKEAISDDDQLLPNNDPELMSFLSQGLSEDNPLNYLIKSDLDLTRVLEDLIDLLVLKGVINFTDFPVSAQNKLLGRRKARAKLREHGKDDILVEDDDILKL